MSSGKLKHGALRVQCIASIITEEGDLVVAGTWGTLLGWVDCRLNDEAIMAGDPRALVNVAWDDYMYTGGAATKDPPEACTSSQKGVFIWHTEVRNIRRVK